MLTNTIEIIFQDLSTGRIRPVEWAATPLRLPSIGQFCDIYLNNHVAICVGVEQIDQLQDLEM